MCNIEDNHTHQAHHTATQPTHHHPPGTVPDVPTHYNLEPELDRSRRGIRPISAGRAVSGKKAVSKGEDLVVLALVGMQADSRAGSGRLTPEALRRDRSALVGAGQRCSSRARSAARVRWSSRSRVTAARMVRSMSKNMAIPFVLVSLGSCPGGGTTKRTADRSSVVVRLKKSNHRTCRFPSAWRCEVQDCRGCAASVERDFGVDLPRIFYRDSAPYYFYVVSYQTTSRRTGMATVSTGCIEAPYVSWSPAASVCLLRLPKDVSS